MPDTAPSFTDRYRRLGMLGNPFTAPTFGAPACTAFVPRGLPFEPPAPWSRSFVQVLGDSGFGKTSQIEHWREKSPGPYHYIPRRPYADRWQSPPLHDASNGVVYGDEIDRMPRVLRRRWFHQLAEQQVTLIVGTHVDLGGLARRAGFTIQTHVLEPFDRDTLIRALDRRLDVATVLPVQSADVDPRFSAADIDVIMLESRGVPEVVDVVCHRLLAQRANQLS